MARKLFVVGLGLFFAVGIVFFLSQKTALQQSEHTVTVDRAQLKGTLWRPSDGNSRSPVVVLLHGSGPDGRTNQYYAILATEFAKAGYSTFIYDKRGSGASTGNWINVPFQTLIDDAVSVVRYVKSLPEVDARLVIIWGGSEGGSIAPEVAVRTDADGVIVQSASGVPFWIQNRYQNIRFLQREGLSDVAIDKEMKVHEAAMDYARTGEGWVRFERLRANGTHLPINTSQEDPWWAWYGTKMDYEPSSWLNKLNAPILAMWGGEDVLVPVQDSKDAFRSGLRSNENSTLVVISQADHSMTQNGNLVHLRQMRDWLLKLRVP